MADEAEAKMDAVTNAVQGLATLLDKDGALCTSWILVSEWMDSHGNFWFSTHTEPDMPIWRTNGMLSHAQSSVVREHFTESGSDDGDFS
jgi:hypothetical protein